ncbi:MAG: phage head morphogenesis protein [Leptospirales bacterium]|nr:phage head morphogenesis protein [Leptospirales bacterium]
MGSELPADAEEIIKKWADKSYTLGLGQKWEDDKWKVTDREAIDFLKRHDQYFFGKQFEHYAPEMREIIENELKGIARAYDPKVIKSLKNKMGSEFEHPYIKDYYDLVVRNAVNKSRNFGRTLSYERLGIAELEIVAILDDKTSDICREMNGRRISTSFAAEHVRETLDTPMDELKERFAWPTKSEVSKYAGMSTDDILKNIKVPLPPYHARCRTTTVISMDTKIVTNSGVSLNTKEEPDYKYMSKAEKAKLKELNSNRWEEYKNLSINEWSSKINGLSASLWSEENLDFHWEKHKKDFDKYAKGIKISSKEEYEKFSKKLLTDFNRCFVYNYKDESNRRVMFYNSKNNCVVAVDVYNNIKTCYPLEDGIKQYKNIYMELVHGKESN